MDAGFEFGWFSALPILGVGFGNMDRIEAGFDGGISNEFDILDCGFGNIELIVAGLEFPEGGSLGPRDRGDAFLPLSLVSFSFICFFSFFSFFNFFDFFSCSHCHLSRDAPSMHQYAVCSKYVASIVLFTFLSFLSFLTVF